MVGLLAFVTMVRIGGRITYDPQYTFIGSLGANLCMLDALREYLVFRIFWKSAGECNSFLRFTAVLSTFLFAQVAPRLAFPGHQSAPVAVGFYLASAILRLGRGMCGRIIEQQNGSTCVMFIDLDGCKRRCTSSSVIRSTFIESLRRPEQ